jgi:carotenoid cleavage dioxygenase-like enzyme
MTVAAYATAGLGTSPEVVVDRVPVTGGLPDWLHGTLLRNGPGTFQAGQQRLRHWFDGLAMLHRFTLAEGTVSYGSRFLECRARNAVQETGRLAFPEFATDPCRSLFARVGAVFHPEVTDSAKVNIARIANRYLALAETPIQVEFDPQTLRSAGVVGWDTSAFGRMTTVHPHLDHRRGEGYNLVTRYGAVSRYALRRFSTTDRSLSSTTLATRVAREPAYLHSFGMSERYLVIAEFPFVVNPLALLLWLRPYIENFRWRPSRGTRFHVIDRRDGTQVGSWEAEPFFAFHHVNAVEVGDDLLVDLVAYDDASIIDAFYVHRLEDPGLVLPPGTLRRYRVPLGRPRASVTAERLSDTVLELPSFDYDRMSMSPEHRFVYGMGLHDGSGFYDQLVKIDVADGGTRTWHEQGSYPGEPVFAGRPGRTAEDDGVLLSVVLDADRGTSFLLVLDATTLTEVARAELPHPVLLGYHGQFYAD